MSKYSVIFFPKDPVPPVIKIALSLNISHTPVSKFIKKFLELTALFIFKKKSYFWSGDATFFDEIFVGYILF